MFPLFGDVEVLSWSENLGMTGAYILAGVVLLLLSFKVSDWLTPGNLMEEVMEKGNVALALVTIGSWLGDALIIGAVFSGNSDVHDSLLFPILDGRSANLLANTVVWGVLGIVVKTILFLLFLGVTRKWKISVKLREKNLAAGVLVGGMYAALGVLISMILKG